MLRPTCLAISPEALAGLLHHDRLGLGGLVVEVGNLLHPAGDVAADVHRLAVLGMAHRHVLDHERLDLGPVLQVVVLVDLDVRHLLCTTLIPADRFMPAGRLLLPRGPWSSSLPLWWT